MTAANWIALAQAIFLALAALFAFRAYRLATDEHREARAEARKAPLRELHADVIREFKELVNQRERDIAGLGHAEMVGQQQRLGIALTFLPPNVFNLFVTEELATCTSDKVTREKIDTASQELLRLFAEIDDGKYSIRQVAPTSLRAERVSKGDL
jgi:hypothetical protein